MVRTLLLNSQWDLELDSSGNLALADPDLSLAQDVASAIRTFLGECWYDTSQGLPYFTAILGQRPPASLVTAKIEQAAKTVPDVASATVTALALKDRALMGAVRITRTTQPDPLKVTF